MQIFGALVAKKLHKILSKNQYGQVVSHRRYLSIF